MMNYRIKINNKIIMKNIKIKIKNNISIYKQKNYFIDNKNRTNKERTSQKRRPAVEFFAILINSIQK